MSLAVDGRLRVVTFATFLPPLKVVTVTFETVGFVAVFRVLRFAGALVAVLEGVAVGIRDLRVYSIIIKEKRLTFLPTLQYCNKMKQLLQPF